MPWSWAFTVERVTRIELALSAWEADVLPLNYTRGAPGRAKEPRTSVVTTSYRNPPATMRRAALSPVRTAKHR
jgi:hypothetical protein